MMEFDTCSPQMLLINLACTLMTPEQVDNFLVIICKYY